MSNLSGYKNNILVNHLKHSAEHITHMIHRTCKRHCGMKEQGTIRLVQGFVISRITYTTPYTVLSKTELEKVNVVIRKAYKQALGLPMSTFTARSLGRHNRAEELIETHHASYKLRLGLYPARRLLLATYKWQAQGPQQRHTLSPESCGPLPTPISWATVQSMHWPALSPTGPQRRSRVQRRLRRSRK